MSIKRDRGYVRVSTLKDSQKDSPEHQEAFIRETAGREGVEIEKFYEDRDTATNIVERDDVQRIIEDAKRGEIRSIWFASLSRFSRDALDAITLKRILVNALKVRVISIEDGYDSGKKDDELLFGIKSVVNQNTSGDISTSSRRGIRASAAKGNYIGSIPPYGYQKVTIDGRKTLELVPDKAQIVAMIFDLYLGGLGEKSIVNYLNGKNDDGIIYPSYRGGSWGLTSVQRILQNEIYTGYNVYGRHTTEVAYDDLANLMNRRKKLVMKPKTEWEKTSFQTHEAIITTEIFQRAEEIRLLRGGGERGGRRSFVNVFAKLIFCKDCGSAIVCMSSNVRENTYRYLMCSRRRRYGAAGCPNGKWLPYFDVRDDLIAEIQRSAVEKLQDLESRGADEVMIDFLNSDHEKEKKQLEKLVETNRKLLFELRRQHMLGEVSGDQYQYEKEQYEREIGETERRQAVIAVAEKRSRDIERVVEDMRRALTGLENIDDYNDVDMVRGLLLGLVKRIEVDQNGAIKLYLTI